MEKKLDKKLAGNAEERQDDTADGDFSNERIDSLKYLNALTYTKRLAPPTSWVSSRATSIGRYPVPTRWSDLSHKVSVEAGTPSIRVLILEDDLALQEVFSMVLAPEEGFEVQCVVEVATCLECLQAKSEHHHRKTHEERLPFDVLLLDVCLHGGQLGTEVLTAALDDPGLHLPPTIICTALSDTALDAVLKNCMARLLPNNIQVLLKPFNIETLTTVVRSAASSRTAVFAGVCLHGI